ncbi:hypothetical protein BDQ12DRAFT_734277 [Crucibulum laeve]|uniref:Fungal pheromone mating factor STE2 GPCR-domain-containing protein n=1 Tax=Crucibulum laeve TaxID=68775 RepID=A0A5C3M4C4_9AGAR|nr:hypothetical protein BDQ12DRAFT_734277 [Crucibulum laeve]
MSNPYRPIEEFPGQLFQERTWLEGAILLGVAYGVELTVFCMSFHLLFQQTTRSNLNKNGPLMLYISALFILGTLFMASAARMTQLAFIDNRNYPGGPAQFEVDMFSIPVDNLGNVAFVIANWLADGLMVWRWYVIYQGCGVPMWVVMALPGLMLTGSFTMGILFLIQVSALSPWDATTVNFTLPYFLLSLILNIISTIAIVTRLLYYRRRTSKALGTAYGAQYTSIAAMVVESAALYSISSILFLVPFILNHPIQNTFLQMLSPVQVIAPLLIILRVAQGKAWSGATANALTSQKSSAIKMGNLSNMSGASATLKSGFSTTSGVTISQDVYIDGRGKFADV